MVLDGSQCSNPSPCEVGVSNTDRIVCDTLPRDEGLYAEPRDPLGAGQP